MLGRKENERKVYKMIEEILNDSPFYISDYYSTIQHLSYTTQYSYIKYVLDFINYIEKNRRIELDSPADFTNIKASMINSYVNSIETNHYERDIENKNGNKANRFYGIKSFFNYLYADDYIPSNPCDKVAIPKDKVEHKITSLTKEEIETIKNNIFNGVGNKNCVARQKRWMNRDYAIIMLGLSTGLRVTSIAEINIEDIDFDDNTIIVTEKGNKTRTIRFSDNMKEILLVWKKDRMNMLADRDEESSVFFISRNMHRMNKKSIGEVVKKYTYNIDKRITPHKLRSTFATNLYDNTGDIYLVANTMGHSNIKNTMRYAKVSDDKLEKAASIMDDFLF